MLELRCASFKTPVEFNHFFEGVGALHLNKEHVVDFYKDARNLKLEIVYCDRLQACVRALGIIFHKITGPFWRMLP